MPPSLQSLVDAAEESFKSHQIGEAIKHAEMARDQIERLLVTYHVHEASRRKINGDHDWYAVLGIEDCNADAGAIKIAYEKLVRKVHLDKNSSAAANDAFRLVLEAGYVLSEPNLRRDYDQKRGNSTPPPWKQHRFDEQDESTPPKSSKGQVTTSDLVRTDSGSWLWWVGRNKNNIPVPPIYGAAAAGSSATSTSHQATPPNNTPTTSEPVWGGPGSWRRSLLNKNNPVQPIYGGGAADWSGATPSYQAMPPNSTPMAGPMPWWLPYGNLQQYAQGSSTQFITPPLSVLITGSCHYCKNQLTLTSIPGGTRWAMSCIRCNWSYFP